MSRRRKIQFIQPKLPPVNLVYKDLVKIYRSGCFTNMGAFERKLEKEFSGFLGGGEVNSIAVSNATVGLLIAIKAINPDKNKYVILPSFGFTATLEAVLWNNLSPIFADIDEDYWSLKFSDQIEDLFVQNKIGLILFCNPHGLAGKIDDWEKASKKYNVPMLIDSAAGFGSRYMDGTLMGLKGDMEVFSLHATKTLAVGEGGLIVTKNLQLAKKVQSMKNFGFDENRIVNYVGLNAKMAEVFASIGLNTLSKYDETMGIKKSLAQCYVDHLDRIKITHPNSLSSIMPYFPIVLPSIHAREAIEKKLTLLGVEYRHYYNPLLHEHPAFKTVPSIGDLPISKAVSSKILNLPLHLYLKQKDIIDICKVINEVISKK